MISESERVLGSENINLSPVACQSRMIVIVSAITSVIAQPYKLHPQADRTMFPLHPHLPPIGYSFGGYLTCAKRDL